MKIITSRRKAREKAVQLLYSWQVSHNDFLDIESYFFIEYDMVGVNVSYFHKLCVGVVGNTNILDSLMKPYLFRKFEKLGHIELAVLRIAIFELVKCLNIPYKVIINEAIELAKIFGGEKSYRFINGVLDKVAIEIRFH